MKAGRRAVALGSPLFLAALLANCGDPILLPGDLPGTMRLIMGDAPVPELEQTEATSVTLTESQGLVVSPEGLLYVADGRGQRLYEVDAAGAVRVVATGASCAGGKCLERPRELAFDPDGTLAVSDPIAQVIWAVDPVSGAIAIRAGGGTLPPGNGVLATDAELEEPIGVHVAGDGTLYFSDRGTHEVWSVDRDGRLGIVAGRGVAGFGGDGGATAQVLFRSPGGITMLGDMLYVADTGNHVVWALNLVADRALLVAGLGVPGFIGDGTRGRQSALRGPEAVAVTSDGRALFIADRGNGRVRRLALDVDRMDTFAGTGETAYSGSGLAAGETALAAPIGLAVAFDALLYISDRDNGLVWRTPIRF